MLSEPPAMFSGCCVYNLRALCAPLEIVTVPPPVFCSFTQSYLRLASVALVSSNPGSRGAGPPVAVPL